MTRKFLRVAEVAPMLGVTSGRIYQLIAAGALPAARLGRSILIPGAAWDAWVEARVTEAGTHLLFPPGREAAEEQLPLGGSIPVAPGAAQ